MRLVVQRVKEASVTVEDKIVGKIGTGVLVFFAVQRSDDPQKTLWLAQKLVNLRIFQDPEDKMNLSLLDIQGEALIVSQFTLYGDCSTSRRPDFFESAPGEIAKPIYEKFVAQVGKELGAPLVQTGIFAAKMAVSLVNDGPITLIIDGK